MLLTEHVAYGLSADSCLYKLRDTYIIEAKLGRLLVLIDTISHNSAVLNINLTDPQYAVEESKYRRRHGLNYGDIIDPNDRFKLR